MNSVGVGGSAKGGNILNSKESEGVGIGVEGGVVINIGPITVIKVQESWKGS